MANETTQKSTGSRATKTVRKDDPEIVEQIEASSVTVEQPKTKQSMRAKDVDLTQFVTVRNGFQGKLIYISKKTGEVYEWDEFGAEQELELLELKNAKNSNKKFFINNWFMFDDPWVIDFLGVKEYYKNTIPLDEFDDICFKDAKELEAILHDMPDGQKRSVAYRARQLISDGAIDSLKAVAVLEKELGVELIEH